jgi:hypothetical protein
MPQIHVAIPLLFFLALLSQNASKIEQYQNLILNSSSMRC